MDFAKNLLLKYGWKEGRGIGKRSDGIIEPIKANLKFDNTGFCYDKATEFTDHWWERAFNSAAENLKVNNSIDVELSVKNDYDEKSYDSSMVGVYDSNSENIKDLTDDYILKACGGRTAHKGARHGLLSIGKLNRIDAQEQQMLEKIAKDTEVLPNIFNEWVNVANKKKKKKCDIKNESTISISEHPAEQDYKIQYKSKKKKRQHRDRDEDLANSLSNLKTEDSAPKIKFNTIPSGVNEPSKIIKKKKKSKVKKHSYERTNLSIQERQLNKDDCDSGTEQCEDPLISQIVNVMKKQPKKKRFKVVPKDLTLLQEKSLKKCGLRIDFKPKNKQNKKRKIRERIQVNKISKKIEQSLLL